jgi:hypothetical protein
LGEGNGNRPNGLPSKRKIKIKKQSVIGRSAFFILRLLAKSARVEPQRAQNDYMPLSLPFCAPCVVVAFVVEKFALLARKPLVVVFVVLCFSRESSPPPKIVKCPPLKNYIAFIGLQRS